MNVEGLYLLLELLLKSNLSLWWEVLKIVKDLQPALEHNSSVLQVSACLDLSAADRGWPSPLVVFYATLCFPWIR